jgi:hypothetical protein
LAGAVPVPSLLLLLLLLLLVLPHVAAKPQAARPPSRLIAGADGGEPACACERWCSA